ncbi:MAG: isoprenyl transferase [Rhodobacteraceae bacterium]|nr:isoprenyl transferase [Paracoccaceae bacterium]
MAKTGDQAGAVAELGKPCSGLPQHVALIMDGNGRWANARGLARTEGHRRGLETLRRVIRHSVSVGLDYVTIFSFSSENWRRPSSEVSFLMSLLKRFVQRDLSEIHKANVRIRVIGERNNLEESILKLLVEAEEVTSGNTGMTLVIAFNYGSRNEIVRATKSVAAKIASGALCADDVSEDTISQHLDTAGIPDPDLIIRTSGELRLSNFLLWQAAYTEFYFTDCSWPEFDEAEYDKALSEFSHRERRFGAVEAKVR